MEADLSPRGVFMEVGLRASVALGERPDTKAVARLQDAASEWRAQSQFFYAGYCLTEATHLAWGDPNLMRTCLLQAFDDFAACCRHGSAPALEAVTALKIWTINLERNYLGWASSQLIDAVRGLEEELAERLRSLGEAAEDPDERSGLLVRGIHVTTDFAGSWNVEFEEPEVNGTYIRFGADWASFALESAFRTFIRTGDYAAAAEIAKAAPGAFKTPGLLGWRAAVDGLLHGEHQVEKFSEAADHFEQDTQGAATARGATSWSSVNLDLWAKFFRARAAVSETARHPENARESVARAKAYLVGTDSGWVHPQVTCLRVLLDVLAGALRREFGAAESAKEELVRLAGWRGLGADELLAMRFIDEMERALDELRDSPSAAMVSGLLPDALRTLGRISLIGRSVAAAMEPALGATALSVLLGGHVTWIHRTLESIRDEAAFRMVILRLLQAGLPRYAQIRHGPLEFGKDIAALVDRDGVMVLELFQAKIGDIDKGTWSKARDQLEEMFQVEMSTAQLGATPDRREGILVFNGHVTPHAEPVVEGWLEEQRRDHNRSYWFMHLDEIVKWVVDQRLINEFRAALDEVDLGVVDPPQP